ncbi:TMEM18 [Symbiodinium microadriaticum]|nr:TMEM18 [Symbiodinium microadriaticum]
MFAVIFRKNVNIQTGIFLLVTILVAMSEFLNSYCADHWREFSSQNYFDKRGVFAGSIFAAPLLIIALFQLINFLIMSSSALVTAKRLELRRKRATQTSSASDTGEGSQQHEEVRAPLDGNKEKAARNRKRDGQTKKEK